jgi:hypothetical protein
MERYELDPEALDTINEPFNEEHRQRLVASMRQSGWEGRELLVEEVRRYGSPQYFAWTGSHRVAAAIEAGLRTVPCRLLSAVEADDAFVKAGYVQYGYNSWRSAITGRHGPGDTHRLRGLEAAGLEDAARMLREEMAATDGYGA